MSLNLAATNRIMAAAIAQAEELNIKVSVAVVDAGGRLLGLQRMDGAIWASAYGCQGKAVASAAFGQPSGAMQARGRGAHTQRHSPAFRFRDDIRTGRRSHHQRWSSCWSLWCRRRHQRRGRTMRRRRRRRALALRPISRGQTSGRQSQH